MQLNKKPESFMTGNGMKCVLIAFLSEDIIYSLLLFSSMVPIPSIHLNLMYSLTDLQPASLAFLLNSSTSASVTRRRITVERTVDGSGALFLMILASLKTVSLHTSRYPHLFSVNSILVDFFRCVVCRNYLHKSFLYHTVTLRTYCFLEYLKFMFY